MYNTMSDMKKCMDFASVKNNQNYRLFTLGRFGEVQRGRLCGLNERDRTVER